MNRIFARTRRASAVPSLVLATVVVAGGAAAQDGPVMLTGLPLGAIDTGAQNGPVLEAALPAGACHGSHAARRHPLGGGVSLAPRCRRQAKLDHRRSEASEPSLGAGFSDFGRQAIETSRRATTSRSTARSCRRRASPRNSLGRLHIRGEHANLQFRINGVIMPEGISFFGQEI